MFLNIHSYYSLRYGTLSVQQILEWGRRFGVKKMALTDINSTTACLDFIRYSKSYGICPAVGVDFRKNAGTHFVMLAKSNVGLEHINRYLSEFLHCRKGNEALKLPTRAKQLPDTFVIYPFQSFEGDSLWENEFLGVRPSDLNRLKFSPWKNRQDKLVVLQSMSFLNKKGFNTHRLLRAIDNNCLLSKLPRSEQGNESDIFIPETQLRFLFSEFPKLLSTTDKLLGACSVSFDFSKKTPSNQKSYTGNTALDFRLLKKLTYAGISYRYKHPGERIWRRIEKELEIIHKKEFTSYFLINWKILKYARSKGYFHVGRGSGANSIVAYLLRITDVDPIELDLYFERFINLYRENPPDFDIDFSWQDREDVINFIFKRFKNTALIAVYNTFKYRASIRELGKVFGLPKEEIDILSKGAYHYETLDRLSQLVLIYAKQIEGFPNYLGIHAGGILISEKPIYAYSATFIPPKGFETVQFDMVVAEAAGLYKFDILSQRGLGKIKDALEVIRFNRPELPPLDIHDTARFKKDKKIKDLLRRADAIGCFYVESPSMRMLLAKLQTDSYLGLVAASSVIRPGVAKSGMMREYILRSRFPEQRKKAHPLLLELMPETHGIMVYQEDVIKVAHHFGGLSLGEADLLRRGMSGKYRSKEEIKKVKDRFFENCKAAGRPEQLASEVWRQIESFAGYSFAKGHSASYAVESYQSLFLKAYFPLEYMVSVLNNGGGFYSIELYIHEIRMKNGVVLPPCINRSFAETIIDGNTIYLGFSLLQSLEEKTIRYIVSERENNGDFRSFNDFMERVPIGIEQVGILIKINAFRFLNRNKRELLWEAQLKTTKNEREISIPKLFKTPVTEYRFPDLSHAPLEDAFDEMELLGFPLCDPFDLLLEPSRNTLCAADLSEKIGKHVTIEGYLVTVKKTRTTYGDLMYFGNFIDRQGAFIDTVHFPPVAKRYRFRGKGVYALSGKVVEELNCITIEISKMERLPIIQDPRYAPTNPAITR